MRRRGWRSWSKTGRIEALGWRGVEAGGCDICDVVAEGEVPGGVVVVVAVVTEDLGGGGGVDVDDGGGLVAGGAAAADVPFDDGAGAYFDAGGGGAYEGCWRGWKKDLMEDWVGGCFIVVVWGRDMLCVGPRNVRCLTCE